MIDRVLIVDDEPLARERLVDLVRTRASNVTLGEAGDGDAAVESIRSFRPDAVFLDVEIPALNGFEVVQAVGCERMPPTVFVTAYDEYALRAFDVAAVDYLLKPFDDARFDEAWRRIVERCAAGALVAHAQRFRELLAAVGETPVGAAATATATSDRLVVRDGQRVIVVPLADVLWIESDGNNVVIHTAGGSHRLRETLVRLAARLDPARFVRIHRRYVVDLAAMQELRPWSGGDQLLVLRGGKRLPVSRNYRHEVARRLAGGT